MTFQEVCNDLNLDNTPDWGIINSDSSRVAEFIKYISMNDLLDRRIQFEFIELIIASMNDAIIDGIVTCELYASFYNYIKPILKDERLYPQVQYWISIKSRDEFLVGYLLEKYEEEDRREIA